MAQAGYVYILTNPAMPGLVKIGRSTRAPDGRVAELSQATGVPANFKLHYHCETPDCERLEFAVHRALSKSRYNRDREFFQISPEEAKNVILNEASRIVKNYQGWPDPINLDSEAKETRDKEREKQKEIQEQKRIEEELQSEREHRIRHEEYQQERKIVDIETRKTLNKQPIGIEAYIYIIVDLWLMFSPVGLGSPPVFIFLLISLFGIVYYYYGQRSSDKEDAKAEREQFDLPPL